MRLAYARGLTQGASLDLARHAEALAPQCNFTPAVPKTSNRSHMTLLQPSHGALMQCCPKTFSVGPCCHRWFAGDCDNMHTCHRKSHASASRPREHFQVRVRVRAFPAPAPSKARFTWQSVQLISAKSVHRPFNANENAWSPDTSQQTKSNRGLDSCHHLSFLSLNWHIADGRRTD